MTHETFRSNFIGFFLLAWATASLFTRTEEKYESCPAVEVLSIAAFQPPGNEKSDPLDGGGTEPLMSPLLTRLKRATPLSADGAAAGSLLAVFLPDAPEPPEFLRFTVRLCSAGLESENDSR